MPAATSRRSSSLWLTDSSFAAACAGPAASTASAIPIPTERVMRTFTPPLPCNQPLWHPAQTAPIRFTYPALAVGMRYGAGP